jgi:hypothetical protein|tara:strand:- start:7857 stop:8747 length:891 start_codon:yes stop_codon:yes gene_type:complete
MESKNFLMKRGLPGEKNLFNRGFRLEITHLPTDYSVAFSAFIDQMSDSYNSEWNAEQVHGRMDPIGTYTHTTRAISVVWMVPASSPEMAQDNLDKVNRLVTFLYPTYSDSVGATTMNQGPMWGVKFGNLICNAQTGGPLLGWVRGITVDPALEEGVFTLDKGDIRYLPKTLRLNFELRVIHEHDLGWADDPHEKGNYVFRGSRLTPGNNQPGQSIAFPYASNRYSSDGIDETTFADLVLAAAAGDTSTGRVVETIDENGQVRLETGNSRDPQSPGQSRSRGVLSSTARRPLIRRRG